jgi:hypothetical protein
MPMAQGRRVGWGAQWDKVKARSRVCNSVAPAGRFLAIRIGNQLDSGKAIASYSLDCSPHSARPEPKNAGPHGQLEPAPEPVAQVRVLPGRQKFCRGVTRALCVRMNPATWIRVVQRQRRPATRRRANSPPAVRRRWAPMDQLCAGGPSASYAVVEIHNCHRQSFQLVAA